MEQQFNPINMRNYNLQKTINVESPISMETTYSVLDSEPKAELNISVGVSTKDEYGYFEIYDVETGGERFYGEGGLWFKGKKLTDYDGVFELSQHVIKILKEWKFDTSEIDDDDDIRIYTKERLPIV